MYSPVSKPTGQCTVCFGSRSETADRANSLLHPFAKNSCLDLLFSLELACKLRRLFPVFKFTDQDPVNRPVIFCCPLVGKGFMTFSLVYLCKRLCADFTLKGPQLHGIKWFHSRFCRWNNSRRFLRRLFSGSCCGACGGVFCGASFVSAGLTSATGCSFGCCATDGGTGGTFC